MNSETYILVGLGNPGEKYRGTRHNVGFEVVDELARKNGTDISAQKWDALTAKFFFEGATVHIVKPMTYMNLSGKSVARFTDFYKIEPGKLIVVHDDLDMNIGRLKLVHGGGAGGHNGIRSIVNCLGTKEFYRLKIGIGRPGSGSAPAEMAVEKYVLTSFDTAESDHIKNRISDVLKGLERFFQGEPARAMNFLNSFK